MFSTQDIIEELSDLQMHLIGQRSVLIANERFDPGTSWVTLRVRNTDDAEDEDATWGPEGDDIENWNGTAFVEVGGTNKFVMFHFLGKTANYDNARFI